VSCPNCGAEFRSGVIECNDCLVPLGEEPPELAEVRSGLGRGGFLLSLWGVGSLQDLFASPFTSLPAGVAGLAVTWFELFALSVLIWCIGSRLSNIGVSGWWALLTFVPIANVVVFVAALTLPSGYRDTRKLDVWAKVVLGFLAVGFVTVVIQMLKN
jgi:uncharacterized membrane protein YhaH (DUF805 family)